MSNIQRVYGANEWRTMTAQEITDGMNQPAAIRTMELKDLFAAIITAANPADRATVAGELRPLMKESATVDMVVSSITNGDLVGLQSILMLLAADFTAPTNVAINAVVAANTITAGALNWNDEDGECPDPFTADWVNATLTQAGYVWNGTQWVRA